MKHQDIKLFLNLRLALYILTTLAVVATVVFVYLSFLSKENPIQADVGFSSDTVEILKRPNANLDKPLITITNGSNFDWEDVRVTVNTYYSFEQPLLRAGEVIPLKLEDLHYFFEIPPMLIPAEKSRQALLQNERGTSSNQQLYTALRPIQSLRIRTHAGRVIYDVNTNSFRRMGYDGEATTFIDDLKGELRNLMNSTF